ncbi:MAG: carboxylesterase/lipase family protein [Gammaproteobacteria bacterium]
MNCIVESACGRVRGAVEQGVVVFRGIAYAAAPIGALRWCRPQPAPPWAGVRDALAFGPMAPQVIDPAVLARGGVSMGEDCLSLNIWTPALDAARRPVLVFVHGGGNTSGSGSHRFTHGHALAARGDAVVVTINYRLGALGAPFAPEVLGRPGEPATSLTLHDIAAALRWVRVSIAAFGGDDRNITAIGQSSGAVSLACLAVTPRMHDLFDKLILQSGGLERVLAEPVARAITARFLDHLDLGAGEDPRALPLERILQAEARTLEHRRLIPPLGEFHPSIDGDTPPLHPLAGARAGQCAPVPLLCGTTADEWRAMDAAFPDESFTLDMVRGRVRRLLGAGADPDAVIGRYRAARAAAGRPGDLRAIAAALLTDFHFRVPAELFAAGHAARGGAAWQYVLDWRSPAPGMGACHGIDVPLVFGTTAAAARLTGNGPQAEAMSALVQDVWLTFARHGDPATAATGAWPGYSLDRRPALTLAPAPSIESEGRDEFVELWRGSYA